MDPELRRLTDLEDDIMSEFTGEYYNASMDLTESLKLERKDNFGYFFRLTRKEERLIRGQNRYIVLESRKDGVSFQTGALRRL